MEYTLNVRGRLMPLGGGVVMGILNATPDSFYSGSRQQTERDIAARACQIVEQGGIIVDVGAYSTRPGAAEVSEDEERARLSRALAVVRRETPDAVVSVDTFRPAVARMAVEEYGADIINDVGAPVGGSELLRRQMFQTVSRLGVPYILMSSASTLHDMLPSLAADVQQLRSLGQKDIIVDPGFGFGKTLEQNFHVLRDMRQLAVLGLPVLVGLSRKSMIARTLGVSSDEALNGTTVLNTLALEHGASILRVHDVREAVEAVALMAKVKTADSE